MKALIIYDSFFGNTEQVAMAISKAFGGGNEMPARRVGEVKPEDMADLSLLVVGSPTRAFSPSPAITAFLKNMKPKQLSGVRVAAFDTRMVMNEKIPGFVRFMAKQFGYADQKINKTLLQKGGEQAAPSEGFFVQDSEGPLVEGELERAAEWAEKLKKN